MRGFLILEKQPKETYNSRMSTKKEQQKSELSWNTVEHYLAEKTPAGRAMAIIETEKILQKLLEKRAIPGKSPDDKIKNIKTIVQDYQNLLVARKTYEKIIHERDIVINQSDAKKVMDYYSKAISDITSNQKPKNILSRTAFKLKNSNFIKIYFRNTLIALFTFFLAIYLSDTTKLGQTIWQQLITISHTLFSWVLFTFLITGGILIALVSTFFYFERKEKKSPPLETDE